MNELYNLEMNGLVNGDVDLLPKDALIQLEEKR